MPFGNRRMGPRLRHRKAACRSTLSFSSSGKSSARSNRLLMGNVFRPLHSPIDDAKRNRGSYEAKLARSAQFLRLPIRAGVPSRMASHGNRARARRSAEEYLHYPPNLSHAPTTVVQQKPGTLFGLSTSMLASQIQLLRLSRIILWVHVGETPWTVAVKLHNCVLIREHVVLHARRHREETTHWQNLSLALIRIRSRT
jgi:hypothetical protein